MQAMLREGCCAKMKNTKVKGTERKMGMVRIGFVRHGVTKWNREGRAQGQHDIPLNEEGIAQAEKLGRRLRLEEDKWDYVYASDLQRAARTAEIVASAMGKEVIYDSRLREKTHGRLDGTTVEDRIRLWGPDWKELDHGEESIEDVWKRCKEFLEGISVRHLHDNVLIVSHGAWIRTALAKLVTDREILPIENTSVCVLEREGQGWNCLLLGCTAHLETESFAG